MYTRIIGLLAALFICGGLTTVSAQADPDPGTGPAAATLAAASVLQTFHEGPDAGTYSKLSVAVDGHGTYVTDRIRVKCDLGCGNMTPGTAFNITLKGSNGATLWEKVNVSLTSTETKTWWPNRSHGKGAYWVLYGFLHTAQCGTQTIFESWGAVAGGAGAHPEGWAYEAC